MFVLDMILNESATISFINLVSTMNDMTKNIEMTFRRNGLSMTIEYKEMHNDFHIVILEDKFQSYLCDVDEIQLTMNVNKFYSILKNMINNKLHLAIHKSHYNENEFMEGVTPYIMIFHDEKCDVFSMITCKEDFWLNYEKEEYKEASIFEIKRSKFNKLVKTLYNLSDRALVTCSNNKLIFNSLGVEITPDQKLIKSCVNINHSVDLSFLVQCENLQYNNVYLILTEDLFQSAYRIKNLGIFYLNIWNH